jgi:hypothetical protein
MDARGIRARAVLVMGLALGAGCATVPPPTLAQGAEQVRTGKGDPDQGMEEIGPIEVWDGKRCGHMGKRGSFKHVMIRLKNKAAEMEADYVQIFTITEPHAVTSTCFDDRFVIRGVAFRRAHVEALGARVVKPPAAAEPSEEAAATP